MNYTTRRNHAGHDSRVLLFAFVPFRHRGEIDLFRWLLLTLDLEERKGAQWLRAALRYKMAEP